MYTPQFDWGRDVLRMYGNMMAKEIPHCDFRLFPICTFCSSLRIFYTILQDSGKACLFDIRVTSALFPKERVRGMPCFWKVILAPKEKNEKYTT